MNEARDKITKILEDKIELFYDFLMGFDEAADAILAALPDMIRPLVWAQSKLLKTSESGQYSVEHYYDPDGFGVWAMIFDNHVESDHETEKEAKAAANAHHRAQIMAAFIPSTKGATS